MPGPSATSFRRWMEILRSLRGPGLQWPVLVATMLEEEWHRPLNADPEYAGDVFIDRDDHSETATSSERKAVKEIYHACRRCVDPYRAGLYRIGDEDFWLMGYEWPNQFAERGRRADLVGLTQAGGLVVFECKLGPNRDTPFVAVLEGLDYLRCLVAPSNFRRIAEGFARWTQKSGSDSPIGFEGVVPMGTARPEVVVLADDAYFSSHARSARGAGWEGLVAKDAGYWNSFRIRCATVRTPNTGEWRTC